MSAALQNEMDRLRAERDVSRRDYEVMNMFREAAEQERDAALEREQVLAAHVENVKRLIREWRNGEMGDVAAAMALEDWRVSIPSAASLTKRDLIKQAEALEHRADCIMAEAGYLENFRREVAGLLRNDSKDKRQRAQALK